MEVIACDVEHFHLGVADLDALFVGARIEYALDFQSGFGRRRADRPGDGWAIRQRARQFCAMRQNMRCSISAFARTSLDRARNDAGG